MLTSTCYQHNEHGSNLFSVMGNLTAIAGHFYGP